MPYTSVKNATSTLSDIARTIAVPREHKPIRLPTFPNLERTSLLSFTDTLTMMVPGGDSLYAFACMDPVYPLWGHVVLNETPHSVYYPAYAISVGTACSAGAPVSIPLAKPDTLIANTTSQVLNPSLATQNTTLKYDTPLIDYQGHTYMVRATDFAAVEITFTVNPGTSEYQFSYECIDSKMDITQYDGRGPLNVTAAGACAFVFNLPPCFAWRMTALAVTTAGPTRCTTVYVGMTTDNYAAGGVEPLLKPSIAPSTYTIARQLLPLVTATEANTASPPWESVRANAVGVLFSNVTALYNKEGVVNAARLSLEEAPLGSVSDWKAALSQVHPKDRYFGPLEKGLYTFCLPSRGSEVFREAKRFTATTSNQRAYHFSLDNVAYVHLMIFSDLTANDSQLAITVDRHTEFRTTSVLFPTGYSSVSLEAYHQSQMGLVQSSVFHENPTHLRAISSTIARVMSTVAPVVKPLAVAALRAGRDKLLNMASKKLGEMRQSVVGAAPTPPRPRKQRVVKRRTKVARSRR